MSFFENMAEFVQELLLGMDSSFPPGKVLVNGSSMVLAECSDHFRDELCVALNACSRIVFACSSEDFKCLA